MPSHLPTPTAEWNRALTRANAGRAPHHRGESQKERSSLPLTLLVAVLGGLASSVFAHWYQTWQQEKAWLRDQHERSLQVALDKALEANVLVERLSFSSREVERAFDDDESTRSRMRDALRNAEQLMAAGVLPPADFEKMTPTDRLSDALHARTLAKAQLVMLLYQAMLPEIGLPESKVVKPSALDAYAEWSTAADRATGAYVSYGRASPNGERAEKQRIQRDEAVALERVAHDKLRTAVRLTCTNAALRLHLFRRYGVWKADGAPPAPPIPWF